MPPINAPLRADARRNRERLLAAALRLLAAEPAPSLEAVAKEAGVGIGTLYRHFPTREALVEAVYRDELAQVCAAASALLAELPPTEALRAWMSRYAGFVATKRGMAEAVRGLLESGAVAPGDTRARVVAALDELLAAGGWPVAGADLAAALVGALWGAADPAQAERVLDLLAAGVVGSS